MRLLKIVNSNPFKEEYSFSWIKTSLKSNISNTFIILSHNSYSLFNLLPSELFKKKSTISYFMFLFFIFIHVYIIKYSVFTSMSVYYTLVVCISFYKSSTHIDTLLSLMRCETKLIFFLVRLIIFNAFSLVSGFFSSFNT